MGEVEVLGEFQRDRDARDLEEAPSIAAATVPEYSTLIPAFEPELIPETIRSGGRGISSQIPSLTLSAGLPSTFQPRVVPLTSSTCLTTRGESSVIECATPLCSIAGATTVTSPSRISSLRNARKPGANTPSSFVKRICITRFHISGFRASFLRGSSSPIVTGWADPSQPWAGFAPRDAVRQCSRTRLVFRRNFKHDGHRARSPRMPDIEGGQSKETETMGRVFTEATIESLKDLWAAESGLISADQVRRVRVPDALVDSRTKLLSLPTWVIRLGSRATRRSRTQLYRSRHVRPRAADHPGARLHHGRHGSPRWAHRSSSVNCHCCTSTSSWTCESHSLIGNPAHGGEHNHELY